MGKKIFKTVILVLYGLILIGHLFLLVQTHLAGEQGKEASFFGFTPYNVVHGIEGVIRSGDCVLTKEMNISELHPDQAVVYRDSFAKISVSKVLAVNVARKTVTVDTGNVDPSSITQADIAFSSVLGAGLYGIPFGGVVLSYLLSIAGVLSVIVVPCLVILMVQITKARRRKAAGRAKTEPAESFSLTRGSFRDDDPPQPKIPDLEPWELTNLDTNLHDLGTGRLPNILDADLFSSKLPSVESLESTIPAELDHPLGSLPPVGPVLPLSPAATIGPVDTTDTQIFTPPPKPVRPQRTKEDVASALRSHGLITQNVDGLLEITVDSSKTKTVKVRFAKDGSGITIVTDHYKAEFKN